MANMPTAGFKVTLPIGIEYEGKRYSEVVLDEMCGIDEENMASPECKNNGAKAVTVLLRRAIQAIPGVIPHKTNRYSLIDETTVREMYNADRDTCMVAILSQVPDPTVKTDIVCSKCGAFYRDTRDVTKLTMKAWEAGKAPEIHFQLPKGIEWEGELHRDGVMRLPRGADTENIATLMNTNPKSAQTKLIFHIIKGQIGSAPITEELIRRMTRYDREYLIRLLAEHTPGYDLRVVMTCGCGQNIRSMVDLSSFFASLDSTSETF